MNKIKLICFLFLLTWLVGCKKERNENSDDNLAKPKTPPPAYITPQPGYIKLDFTNLILKKGSNKTLMPFLYKANDSVANVQPLFFWQSTNSKILSVNGGVISAIDTGFASITVTDGVHGVLNINIQVVGVNTLISNNPTTIVFNSVAGIMGNNSIALLPNTTRNISYTIYDAQGNPLSAVPDFYSISSVPFTINGNSITSSSSTGKWIVNAKINGIQLLGNLNVIVFTSDTASYIDGLYGTFPNHFYKPNIASNIPLLIKCNQVWYSLIDGFHWKVTTVTPDEIISNFPEIVDVNSAGYLISKSAGRTKLSIKYKDNNILSYFATVSPFLAGNLGGSTENYSFNFCFDESESHIVYGGSGGGSGGGANIWYGTQLIKKNGKIITNLNLGENRCYYYSNTLWDFEGPMNNTPIGQFSCFLLPSHLGSDDFYAYCNGSTILIKEDMSTVYHTLTNGAGDCSGSGSNTSNDSFFANWYEDGVYRHILDDHDYSYVIFDSDNVCHLPTLRLHYKKENRYIIFPLTGTGIGNYVIDKKQCAVSRLTLYNSSTSLSNYYITTGNVTISEYNNIAIGGTFYFGTYNSGLNPQSINVTEGKFRVKR